MKKEEKGEVTHSLNSLAKTSIIVFIGLALSKILSYVFRVVAARYFGPEAYGLFSLALVISGWFFAFASLGLSEGIVRYVSLYRGRKRIDDARYLVNFSVKILTVTSLITGAIMFFGSNIIAVKIFHDVNLIPFIKIFSLAIPFTVLATPWLMTI